MTSILRKEFRPLLFPWAAAAVLALAYATGPYELKGFAAGLGFVFGCLALAVLPFGAEFENRTFNLFLSQPRARGLLWRDKFLAAAVAVGSLLLVHGLVPELIGPYGGFLGRWSTSSGVFFAIMTLGSAGLLTLISGSTVSGIVLTLTLELALWLGIPLILPEYFVVWSSSIVRGVAFIYSAAMLWGSWYWFSRLELRDGPAPSVSAPDEWTSGWLPRVLRCRPRGPLLNLVRKELLLLRPLVGASVLFSGAWLVVIALSVLMPGKPENFELTLNAMNAIFSSVVVLVAGCLAASEERTLGISQWHVTLPVRAHRQWLIKFVTSAGLAFSLGYLLPLALVAITPLSYVGTPALPWDLRSILVPIGVILFTTGFWVASLGANVVRAATFTLFLLPVVFGLGSLSFQARGMWSGFHRDLWFRSLSFFQLPPMFFDLTRKPWVLFVPSGFGLVVALLQSRRQFRHSSVRQGVILRYGLSVILVVLTSSIWIADILRSERWVAGRFFQEVNSAVLSTPRVRDRVLTPGAFAVQTTVTAEELVQTGLLSDRMQAWIRNSTVRVDLPNLSISHEMVLRARGFESAPWPTSMVLTFPNGRTFVLR